MCYVDDDGQWWPEEVWGNWNTGGYQGEIEENIKAIVKEKAKEKVKGSCAISAVNMGKWPRTAGLKVLTREERKEAARGVP